MNIDIFSQRKEKGEKISMVTCYDYWSARIVEKSSVDCILIGDSAAMIMHGFDSTIEATVDMMAHHIAAVKRGASSKFLIGDLPFMSYRKSLNQSVDSVESLMRAGANAVKLEGATGNEQLIQHLIHSGVPVMGHLGLTPQSINRLGGYRVQGQNQKQAELILQQAKDLEEWGCFSIVLECLPQALASRITDSLTIPTIGIGAGVGTDGQVLVMQDLLGFNDGFRPKFLRNFVNGHALVLEGLMGFDQSVKAKTYPNSDESYE